VHAEDGRLAIEDETGLVFVLLPGGTFLMGAQPSDPERPNYDPGAEGDEMPVHQVTLSPFFISKYEMTQGQWLRVMGSNPSHAGPHFWNGNWSRSGRMADLAHPVERVTWLDCVQACARIGCTLPSEARWEYAARAGSTTIWWTGNDLGSLEGAANVADAFALSTAGDIWVGNEKTLDDGYVWHAPVDSFRANPFGLLSMCGNVGEFCLDGMDGMFYSHCLIEARPDPVAAAIGPGTCTCRGGAFFDKAAWARSANRSFLTVEQAHYWNGLRPACEIRGGIRWLDTDAK
jgi:formylglycine-generating enzyme required for sulfatase activity